MLSINLKAPKSFSVGLVIAVIFSLLGVPTEGQEKIKLGSQPFISHAGLFIALEKGYFSKEGVEAENKVSRASGAQMLTALVAGDYDVIGAGLTVATYNAALRGVDIRIIADKGGNKGERSYAWILVRKDLFDKGLKSLGDLKGRKIGTPGVGTANWIELIMLLEKGGVAPEEVKLVDLNAPDRVSSLAAGTIDAMIVPEPFVAQAKATGKAVELVSVGELGTFLEAVLITTVSTINKKREALRKFLKAYVRGAKDYIDNPKDPEVVAIIAKYTGLDRTIVERSHPFYMDPSGRVPEDLIQKQMEWLIKRNLLSKAVPLEKLIDNSLLPK